MVNPEAPPPGLRRAGSPTAEGLREHRRQAQQREHPPTSGVQRSPRVESTSPPMTGPPAMPTLNEAEYQADAMSVRRGATTRTWL